MVELISKEYNSLNDAYWNLKILDKPRKLRFLIPKEVSEYRIDEVRQNPNVNLNELISWDTTFTLGGILVPEIHTGKFKLIKKAYVLLKGKCLGLDVPYDKYKLDNKNVVELEFKNDKYNEPLTLNEALEHNAWLATFDFDSDALKKFAQTTFNEIKRVSGLEKGMAVIVPDWDIQEDYFNLYRKSYKKAEEKKELGILNPIVLKSISECCSLDGTLNCAGGKKDDFGDKLVRVLLEKKD